MLRSISVSYDFEICNTKFPLLLILYTIMSLLALI